MPVILEEIEVCLDVGDLKIRSPIDREIALTGRIKEAERTKGMHLSGILRFVAGQAGLMKIVADMDEERLPLKMALGIAFEEFAASLYPSMHWQPGEVIREGVAMTCDGISPMDLSLGERSYHGDQPCVEEFKLTWKKVQTGDELLRESWYWCQQGRGYCWGYGANLVRYHICFVNGNYRNSGPVYKRYLVRYPPPDVESTRLMVLKHLDKAREAGYGE
jgi:hypothetical protein